MTLYLISALLVFIQPTILAKNDSNVSAQKLKQSSDLEPIQVDIDEIAPETQLLVDEIVQKLGMKPESVDVLQMNKFIEYWFGYQNAIALPFINKIYVNQAWLNALSPNERLFFLARSVVYLKHAAAYLTYSHIAPFAGENLMRALNFRPNQRGFNVYVPGQTANSILFPLWIYLNRKNHYEMDKIAARKFQCAKEARELLKKMKNFKNDETVIGNIASSIPLIECSTIIPEVAISSLLGENIPLLKIVDILKSATPGKFQETSNKLGHWIRNIPVLSYLRYHPSLEARYRALAPLAKEQAKKLKRTPTARRPRKY